MIYFDHNATTPVDERVLEAMLPYLKTIYGNPSSLYKLGRIARSAIDTAREQLAALIDAQPSQILFTSGGTEANALALANAGHGSLFISAIEHPSVFENAQALRNCVTTIALTPSGQIKPDALDEFDLQRGDFVSVMLANNETGAIQDVAGIVESLAGRGITVHSDAVQALGKIPLSFRKLGVQLMSLSSHKLYGPKGCGALVFAQDISLHGLQRGGDQEQGLRAGTENVAGIVGFGKAAELAKAEFERRTSKILALRIRLESRLKAIPGLVIFAEHAPRLPNTVQFAIPGINGEMLLMRLDQNDIAVSSGSACSASSGEISPVLAAMSIEPTLARGAIRVTLGKDNHEHEVDQFVSVLKTLLTKH
ncbi:MAG: cysteine desulfurase [Methylococcaceae bacterium]|nr:cysteine desulfurase [Methylococcaceae bacterium]